MSSSEDNEAHPAQSTRTSARAKRGLVLDSDESDEQDEEHADGYAFLVGGAPSEDIKKSLLDVCSRLAQRTHDEVTAVGLFRRIRKSASIEVLVVAAPTLACAHGGLLDYQAASGLAAQHKAFQVCGECKLNFALAQRVQRSLACLCREVSHAKLKAAVEKALALIEHSSHSATLKRARKDGLVFEVQRGDDVQEETVSLKQLHFRLALPLQLRIIQQRMADVEAPAVHASSKWAHDVQLQDSRRQQLGSMAPHLFPFPPLASAVNVDSSKRRKKGSVVDDSFARCKLSSSADVATKRKAAWNAAGIQDSAFELLHPRKKPLEIKMCKVCQTVMLECDLHVACDEAVPFEAAGTAIPSTAMHTRDNEAEDAAVAEGGASTPAHVALGVQHLVGAAAPELDVRGAEFGPIVQAGETELAADMPAAAALAGGLAVDTEPALPATNQDVEAALHVAEAPSLPAASSPAPAADTLTPDRCATPPRAARSAILGSTAVAAMMCPTPPRRRAPADTEVDELIDEDVFLDPSPVKPPDGRLAAGPVAVDYTSTVAPFQTEATLLLLDSSSEENPAAWVQRCPHHHRTAEACVVQRAGYRTLAVLDVQGVIALQVRQLRCIKHGRSGAGANDFLVTAPSVFQQIRAYGVITQPHIECLTASVVVTRAAYEFVVEHIRATFDMSGASHLWRSMMQGAAKRWVEHTKMLAVLAQAGANLDLTVLKDACTMASSYLAQRKACRGVPSEQRERLSISGARDALLRAAGTTLAPAAAVFVKGLLGIMDACAVVPGRASPSRKTTRRILMHFAAHELPSLMLKQQQLVRKMCGELLSHDGTFKVVSSLIGADSDAPNARGKPKLKSYSAVCLTICAENGLVVAAPVVPDETQEWVQTALKALAGGPIGAHASKCAHLVYNVVAFGGPLRKFPRLLITDNVGKDMNIWPRVARAYVQGCLAHGIPVMIPEGDFPDDEDDEFHVGYGTVQRRRVATAEELDDFDLSLLVTCAQDIYHARERIMRQVRMLARDRPALLADVKRILSVCSCWTGHLPFTASSPRELRAQIVTLADSVSDQLLELIPKYSSSVSKGSGGSVLRRALNTVAARLTVQKASATANDSSM